MLRGMRVFLSALTGLYIYSCACTYAADWPMWRCDAGRTAVTSEQLPAELYLRWVREFPVPRPAWRDKSNERLFFDVSYEPVVMGNTLFVPSMVADSVTAYDTGTGVEKWRFYTDGPVRFAPVAHKDKLYIVSDDGYLYCLNAQTGALIWNFRGGPADRKVIGNDRLVGMWPARGGPVLYDEKIYFAAGIWPFMGIFIHALDAETGKVVWTNSGSGSTYIRQPHDAPAFAGVAPQGYLAVGGDRLLVSGGRSVPAAYDRKTGKLLYYRLADGWKCGAHAVTAVGEWFVNDAILYQAEDGKLLVPVGNGICTPNAVYSLRGGQLVAAGLPPVEIDYTDKNGGKRKRVELKPRWRAALDPAPEKLFLRAGSRLYGGRNDGTLVAIDLPEDGAAAVSWRGRVEGIPWSMLAAGGNLFVVTKNGHLYCFSAKKGAPTNYSLGKSSESRVDTAGGWPSKAKKILDICGVNDGYCILLGVGSGRLIGELAGQSAFHIIGIDRDAKMIDTLRRKFDAAGLYGKRIHLLRGDPFAYAFPPYLASLIVSVEGAGFTLKNVLAKTLFQFLRPYGGLGCFSVPAAKHRNFKRWVTKAKLDNAEVKRAGGFALLRRAGALPGSAVWTHQYADSANSVVSKDKLVKVPLGLLWFGGPTNDKILPRHGHGPSPQVVGGRLFIEGPDILRAVDVYTGRLLWERELKGLGKFYDYTNHQPGANEIGSNYVSVEDGVYVMLPHSCLRLVPDTGGTAKEFALPAQNDEESARWGFITVWKDLLIATASPISIQIEGALKDISGVKANTDYASSSRMLVVMDRHSGKLLWSRRARYSFRHNAIAVAADKIFCIDGMSERKLAAMKRWGYDTRDKPTLYALEARTGKVVWKTDENVFGTWLGYSEEHNVLLQAGSASRDRATDEVGQGMVVYKGADGSALWKNNEKYGGPCMLHHNTIITQGFAFDLLTGKRRTRKHPLTGEAIPWTFSRNYGCNTVIASECLITFRSGAAGYFDLEHDGGTGNLGGFKSGCTSNLIVADGVLNAPDYTRTCTCSYQNQASLAVIHMPEVEMWTFNRFGKTSARIRRIGINFGAPGDRRSENGTLWLDYPSAGSPSPDISVDVEDGKYFRHHTSLMKGEGLVWVASSGIIGAKRITITLSKDAKDKYRYTVRLHFAEVEDMRPGQRIFSISLQGQEVLKGLDVAREAGGAGRCMVKEFKGVVVEDTLQIAMTPAADKKGSSVLCGVEIVAEGW